MKKINKNSRTTKKDLDTLQTNIIQAIDKRLARFTTKDDLKDFATKDDLRAMEQRQDQKNATKTDLDELRKQTKNDIDDAVAQVVKVVGITLEEYPTKEDLRETEGRVSQKIDKLSYDVSDLRNRVIDLEIKHGVSHAHAV